MPTAKLLRRHAGAFAELLGESALIAEGMLERNFDDRRGRSGQRLGG